MQLEGDRAERQTKLTRFTPRRRLFVLVGALLLGPLLIEAAFRVALFTDLGAVRGFGKSWRDASLYADRTLDSEYWRLAWRLADNPRPHGRTRYDPVLGWVPEKVALETYLHDDDDPDDPRRPVLLFGASFAATGAGTLTDFRWQLERSSLASEFVLQNFGAGGYGQDQVHLLLSKVIDRYVERKPIVVIALVTDTDFHRTVLSFRDWPKPYYTLVEGKLELETSSVGLPEDVIRRDGVGIRSYAWNALVRHPGLPAKSFREGLRRTEQKRLARDELIRALACETDELLSQRDVDYFYLLCAGPGGAGMNGVTPIERSLVAHLESTSIAFVRARPFLLDAAASENTPVQSLYFGPGPGANHPTARGRIALFQAMKTGIERARGLGTGTWTRSDR